MQVERNGNMARRGEDSISFRVTLTKSRCKEISAKTSSHGVKEQYLWASL